MGESMIKDEARALVELQGHLEGVRGQLNRALAELSAASTDSATVTEAVRPVLDELLAVGRRLEALEQALGEQIGALPTTMQCARCRTEMPTTARRCTRCSEPVARA
jgi:hypothetical protein